MKDLIKAGAVPETHMKCNTEEGNREMEIIRKRALGESGEIFYGKL